MSATATIRVREMGPGELDSSADSRLAPDHPFLRTGTWRAFLAGDGRGEVRVVGSLDPRQRVAAGPIGAIGFIATPGDIRQPSVDAAARSAVAAAESWLRGLGSVVVRCPVQFSTWYGHRAVTEGYPEQGGLPAFPMEPRNGQGLGELLVSSGFGVAHAASSYVVPVERWIDAAQLGESRMVSAGYRDRPIRLDRLDDELRIIHAISSAAFRGSWGFSDITFDEFQAIYRPLMPMIDPALIRIADAPDGEPAGFIFAFAEPVGRAADTDARLIVKSVAVLPEVRRTAPGIGVGLSVVVHRLAAARACSMAVHALAADDAFTQRISARWGERFRRYATFEKALR